MQLESDTPDPLEPEEPGDEDLPAEGEAKSRGGGQASLLAAAMLAVGEILEPEKTVVEIEQANDDPVADPPFELDFGDLPPLS